MNRSEQMPRERAVPPILWKILIPVVSGGAVYLVSNLSHQPQEWSLLLSAFVGGVTLVIQFLVDFERILQDVQKGMAQHMAGLDDIVEKGFAKMNVATKTYSTIEASPVSAHIERLVNNVTGLTGALPGVALRLARSEIDRVALFLQGLGGGLAVYGGEDQDWLLALVRETKETIDATSTTNVDGAGNNFDDGFWASSLGQRYLKAQREATTIRGVTIRRLFILSPSKEDDPGFQDICKQQAKAGIDVRILDPSDIPHMHGSSVIEFIIFDSAVSYEAKPAWRPDEKAEARINTTELNARENDVQERCKLFEELWKSGHRTTRATAEDRPTRGLR